MSGTVVVVGAGHMGHGIALCYALAGDEVVVVDVRGEALDSARAGVERALRLLGSIGEPRASQPDEVARRISYSLDLSGALRDAALVQETIDERLPLKQEVFAQIEAHAPASAILATNTASIRIDEIAASLGRPERLVGIHWFHPPYIVPTVEIVRAARTPDEIVAAAVERLRQAGKSPLVVRDVPGFVVNRLQTALRNAALSLVEQGIAEPDAIDTAVKYAIAPRFAAFGLFRLYDLIVNMRFSLHTSEYLFASTGDERYRPSPLMRERVESGATGLAAGAGWYDYHALARAEIENRRDLAIAAAYRAQAELEALSAIDAPLAQRPPAPKMDADR